MRTAGTACSGRSPGPALGSARREDEADCESPFKESAAHSFPGTYLIRSHFILTATGWFSPTLMKKAENYNCVPCCPKWESCFGEETGLTTAFSQPRFLCKPSPRRCGELLKSTLHEAQAQTQSKPASARARAPRLRVPEAAGGKTGSRWTTCRLTVFSRCLVFPVGGPSALSLKALKKKERNCYQIWSELFCLIVSKISFIISSSALL